MLNFRSKYLSFTRLVVVFALALRPLITMRPLLCIGTTMRPLLCIGSTMLHDNLLTLMLLSLPICNLQPSIRVILLLLLYLLVAYMRWCLKDCMTQFHFLAVIIVRVADVSQV